MNTYLCSDGTRVTQAQIDRNIRKAKIQLISNCKEKNGYIRCNICKRNDCKPVDCSHNKSVQDCKNEGKTELCWSLENMELVGRNCHKIKDKLNLQFKTYENTNKN